MNKIDNVLKFIMGLVTIFYLYSINTNLQEHVSFLHHFFGILGDVLIFIMFVSYIFNVKSIVQYYPYLATVVLGLFIHLVFNTGFHPRGFMGWLYIIMDIICMILATYINIPPALFTAKVRLNLLVKMAKIWGLFIITIIVTSMS